MNARGWLPRGTRTEKNRVACCEAPAPRSKAKRSDELGAAQKRQHSRPSRAEATGEACCGHFSRGSSYDGRVVDREAIVGNGGEGAPSGCLRAVVSLPALIVLAPVAALVRTISRWRRGKAPRVEWRWGAVTTGDGRSMARLQAGVDVPFDIDGSRMLTEATVRLAEILGTGDEVYHMIHGEPGGDGEVALPLGPLIQALADRFYLTGRRSALEGFPVMWIALPRKVSLGEVLHGKEDSIEAVPRMLQMPLYWGMVVIRRIGSASVRYHLDLVVPEDAVEEVERALAPMRVVKS